MEKKQAEIRKVYPGLKCFQEGVRQIPVESIPGIREYTSYVTIPTNATNLTDQLSVATNTPNESSGTAKIPIKRRDVHCYYCLLLLFSTLVNGDLDET